MNNLKIVYVDSNKADSFIFKNNLVIVNLNSFIKKPKIKYISNKLQNIDISTPINLCNLASLCYRLNINYASQECLDLVQMIIESFKIKYPGCNIIQDNVSNILETDMQPISKFYEVDEEGGIIYVNAIIKDVFKMLGYADSQIKTILMEYSLLEIFPLDILIKLGIKTKTTTKVYDKIKELL